jgi:hypothetical protein
MTTPSSPIASLMPTEAVVHEKLQRSELRYRRLFETAQTASSLMAQLFKY